MKDESHLNVGGSVYTCVLCICMHAHVQHGKKKLEVSCLRPSLFFEIGSLIPQSSPCTLGWLAIKS